MGFSQRGAHFLNLAEFKLEQEERPEDLFQCLTAFFEDNLLTTNGGLKHQGEIPTEDEEMTPSLENMVVLLWLKLIHKDLPRLVKQRYGTELRSQTLASIKPEISQALDSLLDELRSAEDARIMRSSSFFTSQRCPDTSWQQHDPTQQHRNPPTLRPPRRTIPSCVLCKEAGRQSAHYLSKCPHLPAADKRFFAKARAIAALDEEMADLEIEEPVLEDDPSNPQFSLPSSHRVQIGPSPFLNVFHNHHPLKITIDSGAETNMIKTTIANHIGAPITKSTQLALQADGQSSLTVIGETKLEVTRDTHTFFLEALVVDNLDADILAGVPFMAHNDITVRPAKHQVILSDNTTYCYGPESRASGPHAIRFTKAAVLRAPTTTTTLWPGEFIEVSSPQEVDPSHDHLLALEPRIDSTNTSWPSPFLVASIAGKIRIPNDTDHPLTIKKNSHIGQVCAVYTPSTSPPLLDSCSVTQSLKCTQPRALHSSSIKLDPSNILSVDMRNQFSNLHTEFDQVFNPNFPGYNGAVGPIEAVVNMGPTLPPQRKGRLPQYARNKLEELQDKFDELEKAGVFVKPEDHNIVAEYLNPSFLIKKSSGGTRLITAFAEVGRYAKPQPSLMPNVDSTLRQIAQWKYIIHTDLTSAFYQIPLAKASMKYCGVVTPFKGVRMYARSAMGMPGSETALEELMCRILSDLIQAGIVVKLADDLFCSGNTPETLLSNWRQVLSALHLSNMRLSAHKTTVAPRSTTVLGWIWHEGTLQASPHRVATLSQSEPPTTVKGLRSFIGAYKVLARVVKHCSHFLSPLEEAVAGHKSADKITWSEPLIQAFHTAKSALSTTQVITLPRSGDHLWIVTDGAVKNYGLGATLYITRGNSKPQLAGFFSTKLRKRQPTWIPCEVEALCIAAAIKHYSPYIIQSSEQASVLTDSKPCVQAYEKLCRGEFSTSSRISTFLTAVSRFHVSVRHLKGDANLPSDFSCRNAPPCEEPSCQICSFVATIEESVVQSITVADIVNGNANLPFTTRSTWRSTQADDPDLRRTLTHMRQGTRPSKKVTNAKDVKLYLNVASLSPDGLLIVRRPQPFAATREQIIVPRSVLHGLLTALHLKLGHPSQHQMKLVVTRQFFALDLDHAIESICSSCHQCTSLARIPKHFIEQSTSSPPVAIGVAFATDVLCRARQFILLLRENITSYTVAVVIDNERHDALRVGLLQLLLSIHPIDGPPVTIRADPAPGFQALVNDTSLKEHHITLEIGRFKNKNKNPIAERAVQELQGEILRLDPTGNPISQLQLTKVTNRLNSRIRHQGLSAHEMWTQCEQFTSQQITLSDQQLISKQHQRRQANHLPSSLSKVPSGVSPPNLPIHVGDIVYLHADLHKNRARDRYLVTAVEGEWCHLRKFVGSQLRKAIYPVKNSECLLVSEDSNLHSGFPQCHPDDSDSDPEENTNQKPEEHSIRQPPISPEHYHDPLSSEHSLASPLPPDSTLSPPPIPTEISTPISVHENTNSESDLNHPDCTQSDMSHAAGKSDDTTTIPLQPGQGRPKRRTRLPVRFKDYHMDTKYYLS